MRVCQITVYLLLAIFKAAQSSCNYNQTNDLKLTLSVGGRKLPISLYWGNDPGRAAAALFFVHASWCGYQNMRLVEGPLDSQISAGQCVLPLSNITEAVLALSTSWKPTAPMPREADKGWYGIAGKCMDTFGDGSVPVNQRLHLHLARQFYNKAECSDVNLWSFYKDANALKDCGFVSDIRDSDGGYIYKLISNDESIAEALKIRVYNTSARLKFQNITRADLFQKLKEGIHSFLFVDYDIWTNHSGVRAVQLPPCVPDELSTCQQELDSAISIRVCHSYILETYAPKLLKLAHDFKPSLESIRTILELEANGTQITEAALKWATQNECMKYKCEDITRGIAVFSCKDDPHEEDYKEIKNIAKNNNIYGPIAFNVDFGLTPYDCSDTDFIKVTLNNIMQGRPLQELIGFIVSGGKDLSKVAKDLEGQYTPILLYDATAVDVKGLKSVWLTNGHSLHLALSLRHFFHKMRWTRIGVISEKTPTAKSFIDSLEKVHKDQNGTNHFVFRDHTVSPSLTSEDARVVLQQIIDEYASIIFVNTNYEDAFTILSEAVGLKMNKTDQYVWIVRDWQPDIRKLNITFFTMSFWLRSRNVSSIKQEGRSELHNKLDQIWPNGSWPPHAVALLDAILTMVYTVNDALRKYPQFLYDLHSQEFIQKLESSFTDAPVPGLLQNLTFKEQSLEKVFVFLEQWHNGTPKLLEQWSVNTTASSLIVTKNYSDAYFGNKPPRTGAIDCIVPLDDSYDSPCNDVKWIPGLICLILAIPFILCVVGRIRRYFRKREKEIMLELVLRHQSRVTGLSTDYLVNHSAVQLSYVLGVGRFGRVRLALLRIPDSPPQYVAAKEVYDNEDESEMLQEACTLATLNHQHIIRFIGVCVDTESPLVLTEVAFYGNLRQYLRMRRYLAESLASEPDVDQNGEAAKISAEALTRLARQAALALEYLSMRGIVHRDIRASNCLIDVNRSLKLANFGMARMTTARVDGAGEYACRRRAIFPVLWMAPESLESGVFSTASDIWALGVLALELVTFGARPYGDMTPPRVRNFVIAGGKPPMPRETSPQTMGLVRLCWQREPEHRPTAAEVVAYLDDWPRALSPTLDSDKELSAEVDSGFGDSPASDTLLPWTSNENTFS